MRTVLLAATVALGAACSSSAHTTTSSDAGATDGALVDGQTPATEACAGGTTACLWGTAVPTGFQVRPHRMEASLYQVFPSSGSKALATVPVALDGTWAFNGVQPWAHYYVQVVADFGQPLSIATLVGPQAVPATSPLAIQIAPVQLQVIERAVSAPPEVEFVEAHVFDPATGAEIQQSASVTIDLGGTPTVLPWGQDPSSNYAYFMSFTTPIPAQASYTIKASAPALGAAGGSWTLVSSPPSFTPTVTSPADGATIPVNTALPVSWPVQTEADYLVVELFQQQRGQWTSTYASAQPDAPTATQETIPASALPAAGAYLLDVYFSKATCPATAAGCVLSSTVAAAQLTAP